MIFFEPMKPYLVIIVSKQTFNCYWNKIYAYTFDEAERKAKSHFNEGPSTAVFVTPPEVLPDLNGLMQEVISGK